MSLALISQNVRNRYPLLVASLGSRGFARRRDIWQANEKEMPKTPGTPHPSSIEPLSKEQIKDLGVEKGDEMTGKSKGGQELEKKLDRKLENADMSDTQKTKERVIDADHASS